MPVIRRHRVHGNQSIGVTQLSFLKAQNRCMSGIRLLEPLDAIATEKRRYGAW